MRVAKIEGYIMQNALKKNVNLLSNLAPYTFVGTGDRKIPPIYPHGCVSRPLWTLFVQTGKISAKQLNGAIN